MLPCIRLSEHSCKTHLKSLDTAELRFSRNGNGLDLQVLVCTCRGCGQQVLEHP